MVEEYIKIYTNKSVYVKENTEITYCEGPQSAEAKQNYDTIKKVLDSGFLDNIITNSHLTATESSLLPEELVLSINYLVESITSEVGRALVGLTVLQLSIKAIVPDQSTRLHKASHNRASFSWVDGVPMRVIDNTYITPKLREHNLLKLNADGFMMTRSLAENYPYTPLYKAKIRGAKGDWIAIVNTIEENKELALPALKYLITLLKNRSDNFAELIKLAHNKIENYLTTEPLKEDLYKKLINFPPISTYSARLFEILVHSFYYTMSLHVGLDLFLKPLSQMRSANKKHGNIGDVELLEKPNSMQIIESWDAKFGIPYLRDELEELVDKLEDHPETKLVGFITDGLPVINKEIETRIREIHDLFDIDINVLSFDTWYQLEIKRYPIKDEVDFLKEWFTIFFQYLTLELPAIAPIDEPTELWIQECLASI